MTTPRKFESFKQHVLSLLPATTRHDVVFLGPEKRVDKLKVSIANLHGLNMDKLKGNLCGCDVYVRNGKLGGAIVDVYIPCSVPSPLLKRAAVACLMLSCAMTHYMYTIILVKKESNLSF